MASVFFFLQRKTSFFGCILLHCWDLLCFFFVSWFVSIELLYSIQFYLILFVFSSQSPCIWIYWTFFIIFSLIPTTLKFLRNSTLFYSFSPTYSFQHCQLNSNLFNYFISSHKHYSITPFIQSNHLLGVCLCNLF